MSNEGKKVKTHYRGTLADGTQFDSSYDRGEPLEFHLLRGHDDSWLRCRCERHQLFRRKKTVTIPAAEAYGKYNPQAVQSVPISPIPNAAQLPIVGGDRLFPGSRRPVPGQGRVGR